MGRRSFGTEAFFTPVDGGGRTCKYCDKKFVRKKSNATKDVDHLIACEKVPVSVLHELDKLRLTNSRKDGIRLSLQRKRQRDRNVPSFYENVSSRGAKEPRTIAPNRQGKVSAETFEYSAGKKAVRITAESPKGAKSVAEIAYFGAHVLNFNQVTAEGRVTPLLWTSKKAILDGLGPIRGGIPVIFPQFNAFGPMKSHGFARVSTWEPRGISGDLQKGTITATFRLTPNELSKKMWGDDKSFVYDYAVTVVAPTETKAGLMKIDSTISNTGSKAFGFTCALHSYFPVSDITQAAVSSVAPWTVEGIKYVDQLKEGKERADKICTEKNKEILFDKETDRIYLDVPKLLQVVDKKSGLKIIQETDFGDAVVWNPWIEKAKRMKDFESNEYKEMVCVEVAEVGTKGNKINMKPGEVIKRTVSFTSSR